MNFIKGIIFQAGQDVSSGDFKISLHTTNIVIQLLNKYFLSIFRQF